MTDDRQTQTDHATKKCVAIGGIAYAEEVVPSNNSNDIKKIPFLKHVHQIDEANDMTLTVPLGCVAIAASRRISVTEIIQ